MERPDLFDYNNFRIFLEDMFAYKHSLNKRFTKAKICRDMGLENTRSYFQDILNGKYLTPVKANLIAKSFELTKGETKFFKVLVNFNQAFDDPDERDFCLEQMLSMKRVNGEEIDEKQYEFYRRWYHSVVRMMLSIVNVNDDVTPLQKKLSQELSLKEVEKSIRLQDKLGLIKKDSDGYWRPSTQVMETPRYCKNEFVKSFQVESLMQAEKSILKNEEIPQRTITKMLTFSDEGMTKVIDAIERFSNEINVIVSEDKKQADRLYQMILTLFPHSKGE